MVSYWCVNFDHSECWDYGRERDFWMMQYQYADENGNEFQGGSQKAATTANWNRLPRIQLGDWFVAYLPKNRSNSSNTFFAVGQVRAPRKRGTNHPANSTVAGYVTAKRSHDHKSGIVYYSDAPAFYEDFDDKWRFPGDHLARYAQRIDVERWLHHVPDGVPWLSALKIPANQIQRAFFEIPPARFRQIENTLKRAARQPKYAEETAAKAAEQTHAKGQGFQLDSATRKKLELYAMEAARRYFRCDGYDVSDDSANNPYDLKCTKGRKTLYVEVKGTQTAGEQIILTNGEVEFARRNRTQMVLFILHSIVVADDGKLSSGKQHVLNRWDVDKAQLDPLAFKCSVPFD